MSSSLFSNSLLGLVIKEAFGKFIITPSGPVDISHFGQEEAPRGNHPMLSIQRSNSFLITLTTTGNMFVSPAGEVDLSNIEKRDSEKVVLQKSGGSFVIEANGTISVEIVDNPTPQPKMLKRNNRYFAFDSF